MLVRPESIFFLLAVPLLLCVARAGFAGGQAPQALIASGLLTHEADEIAAAFARHGLIEADRRTSAEWAALLLRRSVSL